MRKKRHVSRGVSNTKAGGGQKLSQTYPKLAEETVLCAYCRAPFQRTVGSSRKFCTPSSERKKNWIRKQALAGALACQFRKWKWRAGDMLVVAKRCVEAAYEAVLKAMVALGWRYFEDDQVWRQA